MGWLWPGRSWRRLQSNRFETYFTFKTEASFEQGRYGGLAWDGNTHPSEAQFGSFQEMLKKVGDKFKAASTTN